MSQPVSIGDRRELLCDDLLIDPQLTTAQARLHQPIAREIVLTHDAPWEGDGCNFHTVLHDDGLYRMYYNAWEMLNADATAHTTSGVVIAYAQSRDGLTWEKPDLGLFEYEGSRRNNILLDRTVNAFDNFYVFKDANPACPADERYKGVGLDNADHYLWCFLSSDGIHFRKAWRMTNEGKFDTLNIAWWDPQRGEYLGFIRDFHPPADGQGGRVRDIRWMASPDFKTWTTPQRLDFGDGDDVPLYTNAVQPYARADHLFVGFPSRYIERSTWTANFDRLPGAERRRQRSTINQRYGLTVTDGLFMCSRDGRSWRRWDEVFLPPGPERDYNWVYGDGFPAVGMIPTPSHLADAAPELSFYVNENHWGQIPTQLRRYTLRMDGFVSRCAGWRGAEVVTRPIVFEGRGLSINFATSAAGSMHVEIIGPNRTLRSIELFGDSIDRPVDFEDGAVSDLAGQAVTLRFRLRDAYLYAFKFER